MSDDPLIGQQLDEYRIEALLGQGGMARVYRGLDTRLDRWVAIKVIEASFQNDVDYIARFEREARAIAQLEHPHIVSVYRYGEVDGLLYMAMRYIQGSSLDRMLTTYHQEGDLIPIAEARRIIEQTCLALDYAHSRGVIHRDVKPGNIMLDQAGREVRPVITDFGLAKVLGDPSLISQSAVAGTFAYIAPEQIEARRDIDGRADIYALGVMTYQMLTGELPFKHEHQGALLIAHMLHAPPDARDKVPDLPEGAARAIQKAMSKKPSERFGTASEFVSALEGSYHGVVGRSSR